MDKAFGKRVKGVWNGVSINYENDEEDVDDIQNKNYNGCELILFSISGLK